MSRDAFLERIRQAARAGTAFRVHPQDPGERAGYIGAEGDLCARLAEEVDAVGGMAQIVDDTNAAGGALRAILEEHDARSVLCWKHDVLDRLGLAGLLDSLNIKQFDYDALQKLSPGDQREQVLAADVGVSSVDYAIAETGTLALCAKPGQERVISLLPPVHVAIVSQQQILPDLFDVFERLDPADLPSNLTLITGPSKTGDIELQLTTGVHGPGEWHVIVVRETV